MCRGSQPGLHVRITWGALKTVLRLHPSQRQQSVWEWDTASAVCQSPCRMLLCSQNGGCRGFSWDRWILLIESLVPLFYLSNGAAKWWSRVQESPAHSNSAFIMQRCSWHFFNYRMKKESNKVIRLYQHNEFARISERMITNQVLNCECVLETIWQTQLHLKKLWNWLDLLVKSLSVFAHVSICNIPEEFWK